MRVDVHKKMLLQNLFKPPSVIRTANVKRDNIVIITDATATATAVATVAITTTAGTNTTITTATATTTITTATATTAGTSVTRELGRRFKIDFIAVVVAVYGIGVSCV